MGTHERQPRRSARFGAAGLAGLALLLGTATVAAGCGGGTGDGDSSATIAPVQSGPVEISTVDNAFRPQDVTVTAGSTVTWTNDGRNDHNIVVVGTKGWDGQPTPLKPGATYRTTFDRAGTFHYYCSLHGAADKGMFGTVQVVKAP